MPIVVHIYINDLDENVQGMVSKFPNDTKIGGIVGSDGYQFWNVIMSNKVLANML